MADYVPVFEDEAPMTTSAAVTGGTVAAVSGSNTVGPAAAGSAKVIGVFAHDAPSGGRVTVILRGFIHEVVNAGGVTAGDQLVAGAAGTVATKAATATFTAADINDARSIIGVALATAADTAKVRYVAW
jgi:hypothetical protein